MAVKDPSQVGKRLDFASNQAKTAKLKKMFGDQNIKKFEDGSAKPKDSAVGVENRRSAASRRIAKQTARVKNAWQDQAYKDEVKKSWETDTATDKPPTSKRDGTK